MAGRPTENAIDAPITKTGGNSNIVSGQIGDGSCEHGAIGEIKFMHGSVNRVDFDCGHNVKSGLLKAKTHAAGTRKKIDTGRTHRNPVQLPPASFDSDVSAKNKSSTSKSLVQSRVWHCQIVMARHP